MTVVLEVSNLEADFTCWFAGNSVDGLFGAREFRSGNTAISPQWQDAVRRIAVEERMIAACDADPAECRPRRAGQWRRAVRDLQGAPPLVQLREINRFANDIVPYRSDERVYRRDDFWASPLQMLRRA